MMPSASAPPPPPKVTELPYGTTLQTGAGETVVIADMDFETYSEAGLSYDATNEKWVTLSTSNKRGIRAVGAAAYAQHPSTEVLCLAYDLKDGKGRRLWVPGMKPPQDLFDHMREGRLIEAWNAGFEYLIWTYVCTRKYGWPELNPGVLRCAMAKARASCLPGSLDTAAKVLQLSELKEKEGKRLLNKFSTPRNPTKKDRRLRIRPFEDLDDAARLYSYCQQDIITEAEASARIPDLLPQELRFWQVDQDCNRRGVRIDRKALDNGVRRLENRYVLANERMAELTGGYVTTVNQVQKITEWVNAQGVDTKSIDEEHIGWLLQSPDVPDHVKEVLKHRQSVGSAAVKKLYAMKTMLTEENRVHDMFIYHGARTGRDAGAGVQPQNMPNSGPQCRHCECGAFYSVSLGTCPMCRSDAWITETVDWSEESADAALKALADDRIEEFYPDMLEVLPGCIRGFLIADEGHDFIGGDYSAIEAVVAACLSGCQWRIDTFRRGDDIYLASISSITGVSLEEYNAFREENGYHHPDRKKGKVAELASGYGGWTGAWKQFGAEDFFGSDEEIKQAIISWRDASPEIVDMWGGQQPRLYGLEGAFLIALHTPGEVISVGSTGVQYLCKGNTVYCILPSGRSITYHNVSLSPDARRPGKQRILFWGYNTNPKMGPIGWTQLDTYGGRLFENVVQAVARDIMTNAAVNLHKAGYFIALRVHDELISHVLEGQGSMENFRTIANILPPWAADWPVSVGDVWRGKRFRK